MADIVTANAKVELLWQEHRVLRVRVFRLAASR